MARLHRRCHCDCHAGPHHTQYAPSVSLPSEALPNTRVGLSRSFVRRGAGLEMKPSCLSLCLVSGAVAQEHNLDIRPHAWFVRLFSPLRFGVPACPWELAESVGLRLGAIHLRCGSLVKCILRVDLVVRRARRGHQFAPGSLAHSARLWLRFGRALPFVIVDCLGVCAYLSSGSRVAHDRLGWTGG